jgi:tetratricopeptide (TPR) repeat protein
MKQVFTTLFLAASLIVAAQKDGEKQTLTPEQSKQIFQQLNIDSTKFLKTASGEACKCIDSISLINKSSEEISKDIFTCIDKEAATYQVSMKLLQSLLSGNTKNEIVLDQNKKSPEYQRYYFEIERWLRDSCTSLQNATFSNNKESAHSMSTNTEALIHYDDGVQFLKKGDYENALNKFLKAVKVDDQFAFAWDNVGICYRRTGKLDEALAAYNKSLTIDPKGITPLHNIPVVHEFKKDYGKALQGYQDILKHYPNDPEAWYGEGRLYTFYNTDYEKALQAMCKAYNIYTNTNSPYRVDAEKNINFIYGKMKEEGKEKRFYEILKENKISAD